MGSGLERCNTPTYGEEYTSQIGRGLCKRNREDIWLPMLCSACSFPPQPAECNGEITLHDLLLLVLSPAFFTYSCLCPILLSGVVGLGSEQLRQMVD